MNIKNLKPKAKESVFLSSRMNKAVFMFGNIDCMRLVETEIDYSGREFEFSLLAFKKLLPSLEFMNINMITVDDKCENATFHTPDGKTLDCVVFGRQFDFLDCFDDSCSFIPKDLIPVIQNVGLSVTADVSRTFLQGIFFAENGDIVATDARRLTLKKTPLNFHNLIVRPEAFNSFNGKKDVYYKIKKVIRNSYGTDEVYTYIQLSDGDNRVITCAIKGAFPKYEKVIPDTTDFETEYADGYEIFKKNEKAFKSGDVHYVRFIDGSIQNSQGVEICKTQSKMNFRFNIQYLKDVFTTFGNSLTVKFCNEPSNWGTFKPAVFGDPKDFFTLVMPLCKD